MDGSQKSGTSRIDLEIPRDQDRPGTWLGFLRRPVGVGTEVDCRHLSDVLGNPQALPSKGNGIFRACPKQGVLLEPQRNEETGH